MKLRKIKSSAIALTLVVVFSKLIGMCRDVVLANYFGTSNISDAYLTASTVPTLLFYFIGHALSTAFLPMYNKVKNDQSKESADQYANNLMTISLLLCTVFVLILVIIPSVVVRLFAPGFDVSTAALAASFIRISAVSLYAMTVISIWTGYLQSVSNFIIPAFISVPRNVMIMLSIVLAAKVHIMLLGVGILLAYASEMVLLFPFVRRSGYRTRLRVDWQSPELKETLYVVLPILLGTSIGQINKIIDKSLVSTVTEGAVSAMSYASVINNAVQEVLVTSLITILFANCSRWVAEGKHKEVKEKLLGTTSTLVSILFPASVGVILLSRQVVVCMLARGSFDETSVQMTTAALCCYTVGLSFLALRDTFVKVFYAYKMTGIATKTSIATIAISIAMKFLLSKPLGIYGLALATSFSAIIHCITLYILLRKKIGALGTKKLLSIIVRVAIPTVFMAGGVLGTLYFTADAPEIIRLVAGVGAGMVVYALFAFIFKIPLAQQVCSIIKKKNRNHE